MPRFRSRSLFLSLMGLLVALWLVWLVGVRAPDPFPSAPALTAGPSLGPTVPPAATTAPPPASPPARSPIATFVPVGGRDGSRAEADPFLTPGAIDPIVTADTLAETICRPDYVDGVAPDPTVLDRLIADQLRSGPYRDPGFGGRFVADHLVPIELGGRPASPLNVWPQPVDAWAVAGRSVGAATKDRLERFLRDAVCAGELDLETARLALTGDWIRNWVLLGRP